VCVFFVLFFVFNICVIPHMGRVENGRLHFLQYTNNQVKCSLVTIKLHELAYQVV